MFAQVYIVQCLVGETGKLKRWVFIDSIYFDLLSCTVFPAIYALTSNRKRKTYEQIIKVIFELATARKKLLQVQLIVSDYEEAWLRAVKNLVGYLTLHDAKRHEYTFYWKTFLAYIIHLVTQCNSTWMFFPLYSGVLSKHPDVRIVEIVWWWSRHTITSSKVLRFSITSTWSSEDMLQITMQK
jgi:hypothetical protein